MTIVPEAVPHNETRSAVLIRSLFGALREMLRGDADRSRTQRAALVVFAIRILSAGIAYLSQVVLARWMGSHEYGIFVFVWVWVLILSGLSPLGINWAVMRFIPEYTEQGRYGELRGVLLQSRLLSFGTATVIAAIGMLVVWQAGDGWGDAYTLPAFLIMFCLPVAALCDVQDCIARSYSWMRLALLPVYVLRPLLILVTMIVAHEIGLPMIATTAAGCAIFACWLAAAVQFFILRRRLAREVPAGGRAFETRRWLLTSVPILLVGAFELVMQNTDVLVLSIYVSPSEVAYYFAALKTISLVAFVHYAVASAVANKISSLNTRGDTAALHTMIHDATTWTFWPSLAGAVVLLVMGKPLLWMFGEGFESAYSVMFILIIGLLVRASIGPAEFTLNMLGHQNICAAVLAAAAVLNLGLNFVLIPQWGLAGAATATAASLVCSTILFWLIARRRLGINIGVWRRPLPSSMLAPAE